MADMDSKTPITVITGFLGSGKTTLVNYILREQTDMRIAVIENEFGEISIDDKLVGENIQREEDIVVMDNGCLCCSIRGDLVTTLQDLLPRRHEFQSIMLETTGVADPAPIIFTLNMSPVIRENFRIDSVVCLVDAKHVRQHLDEVKEEGAVNEAQQQLAFADKILLNKTDLVEPRTLRAVKQRIRSVNRFAELLETRQSKVDVHRILGQNAFDIEKSLEIDPSLLEEDLPEEPEHAHSHAHEGGDAECTMDHSHEHGHEHGHVHDEGCTEDHEHGHEHGHGHDEGHGHGSKEHGHGESHDHGHDEGHGHGSEEHGHGSEEHGHGSGEHGHDHEEHHAAEPPAKKKRHDLTAVGSVGLKFPGDMDTQAFNMIMATILRRHAQNMYRSKGVLSFAGEGDTKFVFQGVHEQIDFGPAKTPWAEGEERLNKLVFIGKGLDRTELEELIQLAVSPVSERTLENIQSNFYEAMDQTTVDAYADEDAQFENEPTAEAVPQN